MNRGALIGESTVQIVSWILFFLLAVAAVTAIVAFLMR